MRDVCLFIFGMVVGILSLFLLVTKFKELSDIINTIAIIVNIGLAIAITYYLPKKITSNRYVTEYFITQLESTRNEYDIFLKEIKRGNLKTTEINKEFKYFSMKLQDLDFFLVNNIKLEQIDLQTKNRGIHRLVTDCNEYNNTVTGQNVLLRNLTTIRLMNLHNEINHYITEIVILINEK